MSVVNALTQFVNSLIGIFVSLCNSVYAVFYAIFALGTDVVQSTFVVVKHLVAMFLDLFSGVLGFIIANFMAIAVLVGGYFAYVQYQQQRNRGGIRNKT
ncbi:hypothetical protein BJ912DRAFT_943441 [Pholiota molesta]|nr:hypothetical protein BJ912DRAFT_943441 [Pholiota molesta]